MSILVNAVGLLLIFGILWWFWLWAPKTAAHARQGVVEITVDQGVYTPALIEVPVGRPTILRFLRKDPSPCASLVQVDGLGLTMELPVNKTRDLTVQPATAGRYEFTCQMRMYRGELVARA